MSTALSGLCSSGPNKAHTGSVSGQAPAWHAGFLTLLPAIVRHARVQFRGLDPESQEDAVQEVVANAMTAYVRLVELGKQECAYAAPLATFAVAQYRVGRRVGSRLNVRDVTSVHCQRKKNVVVERLDRWDRERGSWQEVLIEDKTCTPAELAATRIDFAAWMARLPRRHRRIAHALAGGESTLLASRRFRLSPARISQLRGELRASWREFDVSARRES